MSLLARVTAALRDARAARSSGTVEENSDPTERSQLSDAQNGDPAERSLHSEPTERSVHGDPTERSLRSARERSDRPHHEGPPVTPTSVVFQAAALVLAYPEAELLERLDVIEAALAGTSAASLFAPVLAHLRTGELRELQGCHVQEFDLSRKHALHLTYWTDGDTRRRGEVLAGIKQTYRDSGLVVDTGGELPDYLPMVLEFAVADPGRGAELLQRFRASLELIRLGLEADRLPHAGVLRAVCGCLPGESPSTRAEIQARFGEVQPLELVGLDPVGRRERG